jgi:Lipoproteins
VRVTTKDTGRSVVVRITDRFREHKNRVLDLSRAAAEILGIKK